MYFFFHLFTGVILGFLIGDLLEDRRWILPCAVGAVLPDLIDKPLGHLLFPATIGYGRIYSHTFLVVVIILVCGLAIWMKKRDPGLIALGIGMFSHQILDQMWLAPHNWYFPLFGPFTGHSSEDFLWIVMWQELKNPFELILAAIAIVFILAVIYRHKIGNIINRHANALSLIMSFSAIMLCSLAGILIGWGFARHKLPDIGWGTPNDLIIGGIVIALTACLVWRWKNLVCRE